MFNMMKDKEFNIPFIGLKQGEHDFEFKIEQQFFESFDYDEFNEVAIDVAISLNKLSVLLELEFKISGYINVNCDLSNEPYNQEIKGVLNLVVKFGDDFNDENEEILIIPHREHEINVRQYIYEMIILSLPNKRVHPGIKDGTLESDIVVRLKELEPTIEEEQEETDPRWDALKQLLKDNDNK